jgi:DNA (cytosine-5)-methyltransferase 1
VRFFDLFAGIGGFRLGMERAGHECVGSCEIDKYCRETYKKHFGEYPKYRDVKSINPKELPDFDILCAGFPCQPFSYSGTRNGFNDTRGTLFFEITKIAREKQPLYLFLENVRGLLSNNKGRTFRTILTELDELGYDVEWNLYNSTNFTPQERERVIIIGHLRQKNNEV